MASWQRAERGTWFGFAAESLANACGTLMAVGVIYLIGVAGGVIEAVPLATALSLLAAVVSAMVASAVGARPWLLRRRAARLRWDDPERIADVLRRITDVPSDTFDDAVIEAIEQLPEPERTILTLRFGEPMTLQDIGEGLRLSRERVRMLESVALKKVAEELRGG